MEAFCKSRGEFMEEMMDLHLQNPYGIDVEEEEDDSEENYPSLSTPPTLQQQCDGFHKRLEALFKEAKDLKHHEATKYLHSEILASRNVDLNNRADSMHLEFQESRQKGQESSVKIKFPIPDCLELLVRLDSVRRSISEKAEGAADKEMVESLPSLLISENPLKYSFSCNLCQKVFGEADEVLRMPCSNHHLFHSRCITIWLKTWNGCPSCAEFFPKQRREEAEKINEKYRPSPSRPRNLQQKCEGFNKRLLTAVQKATDLKDREAKYLRDNSLAYKNVDVNNTADSLRLEFEELKQEVEKSSKPINFSIPNWLEQLERLDSICGSISERAEEAADKEFLESLPSMIIVENPLKESFLCAICRKIFGDAEKVKMVCCSSHELFHSGCITIWLKTWNHCPECARIFPKQSRFPSAQRSSCVRV